MGYFFFYCHFTPCVPIVLYVYVFFFIKIYLILLLCLFICDLFYNLILCSPYTWRSDETLLLWVVVFCFPICCNLLFPIGCFCHLFPISYLLFSIPAVFILKVCPFFSWGRKSFERSSTLKNNGNLKRFF